MYNVSPDITCLGKVIGGGLPCAAYGGKAEVMNHLAPLGDVYQAGTLSGNPLAVSAGLSMMQLIDQYNVYEKLNKHKQLVDGITSAIAANAPICINHAIGTMFTVFFSNQPIQNVSDVNACDIAMFNRYFHFLKDHGILIPPSQFEANFVSSEHTDTIIKETLRVIAMFINETWGT